MRAGVALCHRRSCANEQNRKSNTKRNVTEKRRTNKQKVHPRSKRVQKTLSCPNERTGGRHHTTDGNGNTHTAASRATQNRPREGLKARTVGRQSSHAAYAWRCEPHARKRRRGSVTRRASITAESAETSGCALLDRQLNAHPQRRRPQSHHARTTGLAGRKKDHRSPRWVAIAGPSNNIASARARKRREKRRAATERKERGEIIRTDGTHNTHNKRKQKHNTATSRANRSGHQGG